MLMKSCQTTMKLNLRRVRVNIIFSKGHCWELRSCSMFVSAVSPKKKKKTTASTNTIPNQGTIDTFFKKVKSSSSTTATTQSEVKKSTDTDEHKLNYAKCPTCDALLPKANLFIHQIRCYKKWNYIVFFSSHRLFQCLSFL